jgi:methyltransferase-like protein/SAM-dependent methyltransferase
MLDDHTTYDAVPYESFPYPHTHPDRLATIAALLGLKPVSPMRCRVLELGCAAGGNLIPLALHWPESTFVGLDLSRVQVAEGQETVRALGLPNVELRQLDLLEVTAELGKFDYVICHGVYSWVPERVQEKILEVCSANLTPAGIAFVSYNTYPGWHMRAMVRDMMLFHAQAFADPATKVKQARNLLDFLARATGAEKTTYSLLLQTEVESFRRYSDAYLYHEHLERDNRPVYFFQFAQRAAAHGLRYLGEADFRAMVPGNYPPEIENVLKMLSQDAIHLEQYMDFLRNRMFRQTLLCHRDLMPIYGVRWETLRSFHIGSRAAPQGGPLDLRSGAVGTFASPDGAVLTTAMPLMKSALTVLADAWPCALPFTDLLRQARARLKSAGEPTSESESADTQSLGQALLSVYLSSSSSVIEFWLCPPPAAREPGERPRVSALALRQAARQKHVTNLRHETIWLDDFERAIVRRLDGEHGRADLITALVGDCAAGELRVEKDGVPILDPAALRGVLGEAIERQLAVLVRKALVVK